MCIKGDGDGSSAVDDYVAQLRTVVHTKIVMVMGPVQWTKK